MGRKAGKAMDSKSIVKDKVKQAKDHVIDTPTNLKYNLHRGIEKAKNAPGNLNAACAGEKEREEQRKANHQQRQKRMDEKRQVLGTGELF